MLGARARHAVRKLATTITTPDVGAQRIVVRRGTVASVTAGGAADGSTAITVTVGADTIPAPYLDGWTPGVGDAVTVLLADSSPIVLGRITGPPSF